MAASHASGSRSERSRNRTSGSSAGREREDAKMIGQWRIGRTIGKGSSGRVKIAKHAVTGKYAAIKIVPKGLIISSRMSVSEAGARADKVLLGIEREIVIMKLIDHPNVLSLYDVWETSTELYLIMEYVPGGELFDYLVRRGRLPVSEALHYFQQIIHAVDYCHRFNICHRDLKPENLLLDKDKNIKVADFGMAAWEAGERMLETSCGSPHYASPEIVAGKAYHGSSSDIWSCGIILFALLTGRLPFDDDNIRALLQKVKVGVFDMPDEIRGPARDLLARMLEKDPEQRITMPDILAHPFFVSRPPRQIPGRSLVSPPSLDEVERPVNSADDIDDDIMSNLKTLWHGAEDDEIVAALMSKEKTWEKAIYHLLVKYRNKHLENYNMDDDEDSSHARRHARTRASSPAKRKGPAPTAAPARPAPLGETDKVQATPTRPVRPSAPTPKKAAGQAGESPAVARVAAPMAGGKLDAPRPAGPRPPMSPRSSGSSSGADVPQTPAINVHEATPIKDVLGAGAPAPANVGLGFGPALQDSSPIVGDAPQLSPLHVPRVDDATLQTFFNDIATQLNTMSVRASVASNSSGQSAMASPEFQAYMAYMGSAAASPIVAPSTPVVQPSALAVDPNQFADADDDDTEAMSVCSVTLEQPARVHAASPVPQAGNQAALVGLGLGSAPVRARPAGLQPIIVPPPNQRWSVASSAGSSSMFRGQSAASSTYPVESPGLYTPNVAYAPFETLQAQRPAPAPPAMMHRASRPAPPRPGSAMSTVRSTGGESLLARENSYVLIDGTETLESDPALASWKSKQSGFSAHRPDAFGMLKKKKSGTIGAAPYTPDLAGPSSAASSTFGSVSGGGSGSGAGANSPKRSWFNNLFSFKPASCEFVSALNVGESREQAKRALHALGVRVAVVELDGLRALKCRMDDARDMQTLQIVKGIRFRVEFARAGANAAGTYNTLVSLTLEKGAQSTFRDIFTRLKHAFEAEAAAPARPAVTQAQSFTLPARPAAAPAPAQAHTLAAPPMRFTASAPNSPVPPATPRFAAPGSVQLPSAIRF